MGSLSTLIPAAWRVKGNIASAQAKCIRLRLGSSQALQHAKCNTEAEMPFLFAEVSNGSCAACHKQWTGRCLFRGSLWLAQYMSGACPVNV